VFRTVGVWSPDHPEQSSHISNGVRPKNPMGWIGAESIYVLLYSLGASTWLFPVFFGWLVYLALKAARHSQRRPGHRHDYRSHCVLRALGDGRFLQDQ